MSRYLKIGISVVIPFALVAQVLWWGYSLIANLLHDYFTVWAWWYPFVFIIALWLALVMLGFIFNLFKPIKWAKHKIDHYIINKIPIVNKIYNFGKDITDSFIHDIKDDGNLKVVEVKFAGQPSLGVLTDEYNGIVFIPTAPNPLNGFIIKTHEYDIINMKFTELVQTLASLGRINGSKWEQEVK